MATFDDLFWYEAEFRPKVLDDLRDGFSALVGARVKWRPAYRGDADESYPGQMRWVTNDERFEGLWVPAEDLQPRPPDDGE